MSVRTTAACFLHQRPHACCTSGKLFVYSALVRQETAYYWNTGNVVSTEGQSLASCNSAAAGLPITV